VKASFPKAEREHSPKWLKPQRFDIYIPDLIVAIEYRGEQYFRPVSYFGGKEHFEDTVARDARKKKLAATNGVHLIEWPYTKPVTLSAVSVLLSELRVRVV